MIALDTNVLVRIIINDDPAQSRRAQAMVMRESGYVPITVLLETEWVLRGVYELERNAIREIFERLLAVREIDVEHRPRVERAVTWYGSDLDFADALHLAGAEPASKFATFDRKLIRSAAAISGAPLTLAP